MFSAARTEKKRMDTIIDGLRRIPPDRIAGEKVLQFADYSLGIKELPKSNILSFVSENCKAVIRPSGTEPKLKIYYFTSAGDAYTAQDGMNALISDIKEKTGV